MIVRSPPLTRQRAQNAGIILDQDGQEIFRENRNNAENRPRQNEDGMSEHSNFSEPMMNTQQIHDALLDVGQRNVRDGAEDKENENEQVDNANGFGDCMEVDSRPRANFGWNSKCTGTEHEFCEKLTLGELDPALGTAEIGGAIVQTPLQALMAVFLLRGGTVSSMSAARNFIKMIIEGGPGMEMCLFSGKRGDYVESGRFPSPSDQEKALESWVEQCQCAKHALEDSGYKRVGMMVPEGLEILKDSEKSGWEQTFAETPWILEKIRARHIHHAVAFVEEPRVVIGDSSAKLLAEAMEKTAFVGKEGSLAEVIRILKPTVLSSKVKAALVFVGRDSLMAGETTEAVLEQLDIFMTLCERFQHVDFFITFPPYVHAKTAQYEELVMKMRPFIDQAQFRSISTTENGRSILEIFRFGNSFNQHLISSEGVLKDAGIRALKAWLFTQSPFPGDKALNIRTVKSVVQKPSTSSLGDSRRASSSSGSGTSFANHGRGGLGDRPGRFSQTWTNRHHSFGPTRHHPYTNARLPYRGRGNPRFANEANSSRR